MRNNDFILDNKSVNKLATKGLSRCSIKEQIKDSLDIYLEIWKAQGLNIIKDKGNYFFDTKFIPVEEATFCIVDIETNGSRIEKHQIIELSAVKVLDGKIIDRFDTLVQCNEINKHISAITGIYIQDTLNAPKLSDVLMRFKLFLGDAIFIAHDVKFDYNFISASFQKVGLEPILNRSLCSLALAERTIVSYRYALSYLCKLYNLNPNASHHRAMSDVMTTYELFKLSLANCEENINNVEDLIKFSKNAPRLKRPKIDPFLIEKEEEEKKEVEAE